MTPEEFDAIYARVPRLTVEIILRNDEGQLYLTLRDIEPCKGQWHLPGGTVRFGEPMAEAVRRIAARELGIDVTGSTQTGYVEYPSHYRHGLDSPVGIVFEVGSYAGSITPNEEAADGSWFSVMPQNMHADQDEYLMTRGYLQAPARGRRHVP